MYILIFAFVGVLVLDLMSFHTTQCKSVSVIKNTFLSKTTLIAVFDCFINLFYSTSKNGLLPVTS